LSSPADSVTEHETPLGTAEHPTEASEPVTVVLADSSYLIRTGLRRALEQHGFVIVAEARNADEALAAAISQRPELCIIAAELPGGGIGVVQEVSSKLPHAKLAVIVDSVTDAGAVEAIRAGATGFLQKSMAADRLTAVLNAMFRGEVAFPRSVTKSLAQEIRRSKPLPSKKRRGRRLLYVPRFIRHFFRRLRLGMSPGDAWGSARRRMESYR
jgi:DNA-binding NarL/FixJ family response regulator